MDTISLDDASPNAASTEELPHHADRPIGPANPSSIGAETASPLADLWGEYSPRDADRREYAYKDKAQAQTTSTASSARPFDAFDAFDAFALPPLTTTTTSTTGMTLPPALATETATTATTTSASVALGSPLLSFSPIAAGPFARDTAPHASSSDLSTSTTTMAVDDLLSFSPVAAAPSSASSTSASFLIMDDLFLGASSTSSSDVFAPATTSASVEMDASAPLSTSSTSSFASVSLAPSSFEASATPPPAPLSTSSLTVEILPDGETATLDVTTEDDAMQSSPTTFDNAMIRVDTGADVLVAAFSFQPREADISFADSGAVADEEASGMKPVVGLPHLKVNDMAAVVEVFAPSRNNDYGENEVRHANSEMNSYEPSASALEQPLTPTQSPIATPVVSVSETASQSEDEAGSESRTNAADGTGSDGCASAPPPPINVEPLANDLQGANPVETSVSTVHSEAINSTQYDEESYAQFSARSVADEDSTLPAYAYPVADIGSDIAPAVEDTGLSTWSPGTSSPSSETQDLGGFQAISGDSDDGEEIDRSEPDFDAEAIALYAEVTEMSDEGDKTSRESSVRAPESLLHLHVRQYADHPASSVDQSISSPASVTSSTGSSVAGSAFAFIAAGSSSFSFGQSAQSPKAENEVPSGIGESSGEQGDDERALPVNTVPVVVTTSAFPGTDDPMHEGAPSRTVHTTESDVFVQVASTTTHDAYSGADKEDAWSNDTEDGRVSHEYAVASAVPTDNSDEPSGFTLTPSVEGKHASFDSIGDHVPSEQDDDSGFGSFAQSTVPEDKVDDFGGFGPSSTVAKDKDDDDFGGFAPSTNGASYPQSTVADDEVDGFGGFGPSSTVIKDDDDFGGFAASTNAASNDDNDDDFGDFGTGVTWGSASLGVGDSGADDDGDDDFGSFTPAPTADQWDSSTTQRREPSSSSAWGEPSETQPEHVAAPTDLTEFFAVAFPSCKAPVSLLPKPTPFHGGSASTVSVTTIVEQANALHKTFNASLQDYRSMLAGDGEHHQQHQHPSFESQALRLKYLKYVLTEKLSEASRHDGVFPQGSEKYQLIEAIAESGHEKNMREALASLQEALFHSSMNEAVMRIARQAALSAKARIAEQAAQQQAHARGSLLATTRHFLSRSAGSSSSYGPGSNEKDPSQSSSRTGSGVLTPNSTSAQKNARFPPPQNGQDGEVGNSSGYGSGEDTGSDVSMGDSSHHSDGDIIDGGNGHPPSGSSSSVRSGGLMKKFHERFTSLSSTKNRPRTVSLRRMGQSSEEVCKMELNMESINGGFDEVKWRCAGFLFETEEVTRLAPSQIKIYAYPSNQLLTGKTDRSALSKFFKPGTVWSIDIGVSTE